MWEIVPERLVAAMKRAGMNQSQLADAVGVKQPSIGRLISGDTKTTRYLDLIARALDTTAEYLRGETDEPGRAGLGDRRPAFRGAEPEPDRDTVELDEIDLRYGLGGQYLDGPVETTKRKFSRSWLRMFTDSAPEHLVWTSGSGDSMEPTIKDHDIVLIDRSDVKVEFGDKFWAIAYGQVGMIKRLRPMPDGGVKILSDNQLVPPETAYDDEMHVVGRVVAIVRRM